MCLGTSLGNRCRGRIPLPFCSVRGSWPLLTTARGLLPQCDPRVYCFLGRRA